ncbi:unnamed protein product [Brugia timori]|uniref:Uncharacterized protein n=1 Tax=Brugia timori TaxID=42155 RepID=A0A0R3Q576_9BILA|nr:unnamed protein product [Brugia timori]
MVSVMKAAINIIKFYISKNIHVGPPKPELHVQLFGAVQIPL